MGVGPADWLGPHPLCEGLCIVRQVQQVDKRVRADIEQLLHSDVGLNTSHIHRVLSFEGKDT